MHKGLAWKSTRSTNMLHKIMNSLQRIPFYAEMYSSLFKFDYN